MEWVETTARTIEEAKEAALEQLGVAEDDAEFEVVEEPKAGLFGRVRGQARVRARVRPTQPRAKLDRRDRKRRETGDQPAAATRSEAGEQRRTHAPRSARGRAASARDTASGPPAGLPGTEAEDGAGAGAGEIASPPRQRRARAPRSSGSPAGDTAGDRSNGKEEVVDAEQVGAEAQRFIDGLLVAFGLSGQTTVRRTDDEIDVSVDGADLGLLVGPRGTTLQAIQDITRVAAQRRLGDHDTRLRVDVGGYRERRREALGRFAVQVAQEVVASSAARSLEPMSSSDRKVVHDALSSFEGVVTSSVGDDPERRVVISPSGA